MNLVDIYANGPLPGHPVYCMAKAALVDDDPALARDLAPDVRVNAVAPGACSGRKVASRMPIRRELIARTPLQRAGSPEDVAAAVLFLLRDAVHDRPIVAVDGGRSLVI